MHLIKCQRHSNIFMITPDWTSFRAILIKNKIPQNQHHYYAKWVEQFLVFIHCLNVAYTITSIKIEHINYSLQDIDGKSNLLDNTLFFVMSSTHPLLSA